jgi:hypothetical protein
MGDALSHHQHLTTTRPDRPENHRHRPTRMPRGPKATVDPADKRKPGRKGNFQGQRLQLLESFLPDWDKARLNRTTGDFWTIVTSAYWKKFHWRLEQNEEPTGDAPMDEDLTEDDLEKKAAKIRLVEGVRVFFWVTNLTLIIFIFPFLANP